MLSGLGEGVIYAGLTDLLAAWVPLKERTTLGSLAYGGSTVNTQPTRVKCLAYLTVVAFIFPDFFCGWSLASKSDINANGVRIESN